MITPLYFCSILIIKQIILMYKNKDSNDSVVLSYLTGAYLTGVFAVYDNYKGFGIHGDYTGITVIFVIEHFSSIINILLILDALLHLFYILVLNINILNTYLKTIRMNSELKVDTLKCFKILFMK